MNFWDAAPTFRTIEYDTERVTARMVASDMVPDDLVMDRQKVPEA